MKIIILLAFFLFFMVKSDAFSAGVDQYYFCASDSGIDEVVPCENYSGFKNQVGSKTICQGAGCIWTSNPDNACNNVDGSAAASCNGENANRYGDCTPEAGLDGSVPCNSFTNRNDCEYSGVRERVGCSWVSAQYTTEENQFVENICNALKITTGAGGKAFAAFSIISVGIGFFTGKVSWGLMVGVCAGVGAMFGAPTIVTALSGEDLSECE